MELRTPFFEKQIEADGKLLPAGGWRLSLNYRNVKDEVETTSNGVGFIDFSSMGSIYVIGKDALKMVQKFMVNDIGRLKFGKGAYSFMTNENGEIFGDVTVFNLRKDEYIVVTSTDKCNDTVELFKEEAEEHQLEVSVIESSYGILALSGPRTRDTLMKLTKDVEDTKFLGIVETNLTWNDDTIPCIIARAGFTGELSFEIYVHPRYGARLWEMIMEAGEEFGIMPMGILAINSLRLEKGYFISSDFYPGASPYQLGAGWNVSLNKGDFLGRDALLKQKEEGYDTKLVGFEVLDSDDVVPVGGSIYKEDKCIGKITSASFGYRVKKSIAMGWIEIEHDAMGEVFEVREDNSDKVFKLKLVERPFYDPENKLLKV